MSKRGYFTYYKTSFLISLIAFLAIAIFIAKVNLGISFSIVTAISVFLLIIDKWLWKKKPFTWLFWIEDFSGTYEGILEYEYRDNGCKLKKGKLKHVKIIRQSGSKISISSFSLKNDGEGSSLSENDSVFVKKTNDDKHFQIIYTYHNEGNKKLTPHDGTEIIKFIKRGENKYLSGKYYTDRIPYSTKGTFTELKWVSKKQDHLF